jgi:FMN-dependent oxidoreductase (nitrilotriacetate monooxygenase family)
MPDKDSVPRTPRRMKLGLSIASVGHHDTAIGAMSLAHHIKAAEIAERGRMDFLFLADYASVLKMDPTMVVAALAAITDRIGLIPTASTAYQHPYNFARRMASIDHISGGRLGWNMVTGSDPDEASNFSLAAPLNSHARQSRAAEFVTVVHDLFDSWDDDAFLRDKASGIYFDRTKFHFLDHAGEHFRVRGPLDVERPPQGRLPIMAEGVSDDEMALAARFADIIHGGQPDIAAARTHYLTMKRKLHTHGRTHDDLLMMPSIQCYLGQTQAEAEDNFARLQPLPDPKHLSAIGTPKLVADTMEEWFTTGAADGFLVHPPSMPQGAEDFVTLVIPELQRRGLFRTEYEGTSLRENLGLPAAPSRLKRNLENASQGIDW